MSNRDPFNDVPRDPSLTTVVEPRRSRVGMAGQVLHVLQRHPLGEQISDGRDPHGMRGKAIRQPSIAHAAFHHAADVVSGHTEVAERSRPTNGRAKDRRVRRGVADVHRVDVIEQEALQVVPNGYLAGLAAFVEKPEAVLVPGVEEVAQTQPGYGSNSGRRVDQHCDDCPVAKPDDMAVVHAGKESSGLFDGDFRGLAFDYLVTLAADRGCRIEHHGVPHDQRVEEVPDGRQVDLLGRDGIGQTVEKLTDVCRRYGV